MVSLSERVTALAQRLHLRAMGVYANQARCSFCGKGKSQVSRLIAGGSKPGTYICTECVAVAAEIIAGG